MAKEKTKVVLTLSEAFSLFSSRSCTGPKVEALWCKARRVNHDETRVPLFSITAIDDILSLQVCLCSVEDTECGKLENIVRTKMYPEKK